MNSLILTSLASFFKAFFGMFKKSGIYAVIDRIYGACSSSWKKSVLVNAAEKEKKGASAKSVTGRILRFPFTLLEKISAKTGDFLSDRASKSVLCGFSYTYVQNFMAINTRFFGIMLLCASVTYTAAHMLSSGRISRFALAFAAAGALAALIDYNVMGFLNPSGVVTFIKNALGFRRVDFDFYDKSALKGAKRIGIAAAAGIVTGAAMSFSLLYGAAVPFGIFGMLLVMFYPVAGVFAAVFAAPIVPTMVLAALCMWTALSLVLHALSDRNFKWRFEGLGLSIGVFLAVLFVSSAASFARGDSLKVWAMYLVFAGFYFIVINTVKTKQQLYGLLRVFVISGALVALYGVMQYVFGWTTANAWIDETMFENDTMRVYSTLANPNVLGEYLLLVLPPAAVFMLKEKAKSFSKWAYLAIFGLLGLCLVLTQSRGCWIGFMVSVVIFVTFYEGKWWGFIPLVILILPMVVPQTVVERIASVGNMEDSSTSYRVYIWMGTMGLLKHYWLGGIGMGEKAFGQVYPLFMYNAVIAPHSHNTFLQLLTESGISGLGVFLVMQTVFMKKMHSLYKTGYKKSKDSAMALALASAVLGFLIQSLFDYTFYNYRVMAIFFMVMAMGVALLYIKNGEEELS